MRLSRIWRILQIKESVIHRGRRPRWITPSEICRILHILRKPNSIIALLFIQNIFLVLEGVLPFCSLFFCSPNITQPCPQVLSVIDSIICSGLHFWRHFDVIGSIIFGGLHFWRHWFNYMAKILSKFGEQQLVMVNYACGFNQSETGKYSEWIINFLLKAGIYLKWSPFINKDETVCFALYFGVIRALNLICLQRVRPSDQRRRCCWWRCMRDPARVVWGHAPWGNFEK